MLNTVLMDLDGTLLPFEQQEFIDVYFKLVCKELVPKGYAPDAIVKAVWTGTKAMMKNDGSVLNHTRFWEAFVEWMGESVREEEKTLDAFYDGDFHGVRSVLRGQRPAKELVQTLREKGYTVVLATNPIFPEVAVRARLSWAGLKPEDFDHVTHYQNSRFCKPNPAYYREILDTIGKTPDECLMIGNSVPEDMEAAGAVGIKTYLVTGFLENPEQKPIDTYDRGSLEEFAAIVKTWDPVK
ncbi:MAG: HAD family hydrolase [Clostridia bacterium]|nr:HAD family hydrolase [Clostridia bacterium]